MKRAACWVSLLGVLLLAGASPAVARGGGHRGGWHGYHRHGHHGHGHYGTRVFIGLGPAYSQWWGPAWYAPGPVYVYPPRVIVEQPPVYIQRQPPAPPAYWYYCESAGAYYPDVPACPEPWVMVPPRAE